MVRAILQVNVLTKEEQQVETVLPGRLFWFKNFNAIFLIHLKILKLAVFCLAKKVRLRAKMYVWWLNMCSVIVIVIKSKRFDYGPIYLIHSTFLKQVVFRISQNTKLRNCPPFAGPYCKLQTEFWIHQNVRPKQASNLIWLKVNWIFLL